jgi:hypothetical protein
MSAAPASRRASKTWAIAVIFVLVAVAYFFVRPDTVPGRPFTDVRIEAESLADKCQARGAAVEPVKFPAKVLIWDVAARRPSNAHTHLPDSLRAARQSELGTVILILDVTRQQTTEHSPPEGTTAAAPPEHTVTYTLGAVAWSARRVAGTIEVRLDPPGVPSPAKDDRTGDWNELALADWVAKRAR